MESAHQSESASKAPEKPRPVVAEVFAPEVAGFEAIVSLGFGGIGTSMAPPRNPNAALRQASLGALQRTMGNGHVLRMLQRDSSPGGGNPKPGYDPTPDQARSALISSLGETDLGRKAAAIFNKYGVGIVWGESGTAGFEDRTNVVHLNRKMAPYELAAYFIHEMHHAQQFNSGASKGPETYASTEKQQYVNTMVNEEVEATFLQFESIYQAGGGSLPYAGTRQDLVPMYVRVRKDWIARHLKDNPGDHEGAETLSKEKGKALIRYWFQRHTRGTSPEIAPNIVETYRQYYERMFDSAQKGKAIPEPTAMVEEEEATDELAMDHEESKAQFPA